MRKIPIVIIQISGQKDTVSFYCEEKESFMEVLKRQGILYRSDCNGRGICGKCRIRLITGNLDITTQDKKIFTTEELNQGFRLACQAYPREACTVLLVAEEEDTSYDIISENRIKQSISSKFQKAGSSMSEDEENLERKVNQAEITDLPDDNYMVGIDLGTTTLAVSLFCSSNKRILSTNTSINNQRTFGLDVISRMKASNEGKRELLRNIIRRDLLEGIKNVIDKEEIKSNRIIKIVIAGNTTMIHLLLGYSCDTLGVFPFTPVNTQMITINFMELFAKDSLDLKNIPVVIMPGISTFVGGDIVAGLFACEFYSIEKPSMLIDLGTNGEMAIGSKDRILVTSTAAGPAFEGGNISCGVGSISGAISHVSIENNKLKYQTIGDKAPIGICGTGVMEIASELLKEDIIDETGLLLPDYFENGYIISDNEMPGDSAKKIIFTQKDIREFQLAKSAVRAGIETLIRLFGTTVEQIDNVYLAGGFGYRIDVEKAILIGLFPEEFRGKIIAVGNSSLGGAMKYGTEKASKDRINNIISVSKEIYLSDQQDFNDLYIKYMYLGIR